jgi:hypothetical protein
MEINAAYFGFFTDTMKNYYQPLPLFKEEVCSFPDRKWALNTQALTLYPGPNLCMAQI